MNPFVTPYGEASFLLAHAVSGEMPMGMRLTLLRHASDLADKSLKSAQEDNQVRLASLLIDAIATIRFHLDGVPA